MFKEILATVLVVLLIAAPLCAVAVMFWRCLLQFFALTPEDEREDEGRPETEGGAK